MLHNVILGKLKIWKKGHCIAIQTIYPIMTFEKLYLTHFSPMFPFFTP